MKLDVKSRQSPRQSGAVPRSDINALKVSYNSVHHTICLL